MKYNFFPFIILILFLDKICSNNFNCPLQYSNCFNCTTCGEEVDYYSDCPCQWDIDTHSCKNVAEKTPIFEVYQAFDKCIDTDSISIQEKFCGTTISNIDDEYNFKMPFVDGRYGTQSIYCEYTLYATDDDDIYYNINYNFKTQYLSDLQTVHLYFKVVYSDSTSVYSSLSNPSLNKDFHTVKQIILKVYFEKGFPTFPFSLVITKQSDNSKLALYITIGTIILACIICALAIYCLSKKISENARLRQQTLFEMAMAHQQRRAERDEEEDEYAKEKRIENENKMKIEFALKNYLKPKKFLKKFGVKDGTTCTICIDEFKEKRSRVSVTPCKHVFHYKCLSNWLSKNVMNPKCPNCNYNLIQDVKDKDIKGENEVNPERIEVSKGIIIRNVVEGDVENSDNRAIEIRTNQGNREAPASRNNLVVSSNSENQNVANTQSGINANNQG